MRAHEAGWAHAGVSVRGPSWLREPDDVNALLPELWSRTAHKDEGTLVVGGVRLTDLVAEHGSPAYVLDEEDFRSRAAAFRDAFGSYDVYYAGKAFLCTAVADWIAEDGLFLDVCSGGELAVAERAAFPMARVGFHGNNKSVAELTRAVELGVGRIIVDSFEEIERLGEVWSRLRSTNRGDGSTARGDGSTARGDGSTDRGDGSTARGDGSTNRGETPATESARTVPVMVRVTAGVEAHTHEYIATAHEDQKFGFSISNGAALEAVRQVQETPGLELRGLHSHIGSQIFDSSGFEVAARRVLALHAEIRDELGVTMPELDLGGGFGIAYTTQDDPAEPATLAAELTRIVTEECALRGVPMPRLSIEPGRAIVGPSMCTVYEVGTIKPVELDAGAVRTYVSVDGGMSDNIRTALYDADYSCTLASRASDAPALLTRVVGKHCESGDIVVMDEFLPGDVRPGDLLAVPATGAYCRSMASNYNHALRPPVVAVRDGRTRVVVRRETLDDLLATDVGMGS